MDDAIRDLVRSAFGHAGQKCSAASLGILEAPVYDDRAFLARLADAVRTLRVGPADDLSTQVGPLIRPPSGALRRQLESLGPGEEWLVAPEPVGANPHLWRPGVKLGVRPGSELHLTECFGPVLGLMRADDLDHALALQNAPVFGLTGGLHSLDDEEVRRWRDTVQVGNVYINRHITGAIVRRQPFGGWKRSAVGPGAKAGGPHYVPSLGSWHTTADVTRSLEAARAAWARWGQGEDPSGLRAERNVLRLRPLARVALRLGLAADADAVRFAVGVAQIVGARVDLSAVEAIAGIDVTVEDEDGFMARAATSSPDRVRVLSAEHDLRLRVLDARLSLDTTPIVPDGPLELLRWTREQAISETRHRHGNLLPGAVSTSGTG